MSCAAACIDLQMTGVWPEPRDTPSQATHMVVAGKGTILHQAQRGGEGQRQLGCLWVTEVGGVFPPQVPCAVVFIIASFYSGETKAQRDEVT